MKFYNAYIVHGFEKKNLEGNYVDDVQMEIVADSEKEALMKAKKTVSKNDYKIESVVVVEKHTDDKYKIFIFQCYEDIEDGKFTNFAIVEVTCETSQMAEKIVRNRIAKKNYRLWKIIEKYANS